MYYTVTSQIKFYKLLLSRKTMSKLYIFWSNGRRGMTNSSHINPQFNQRYQLITTLNSLLNFTKAKFSLQFDLLDTIYDSFTFLFYIIDILFNFRIQSALFTIIPSIIKRQMKQINILDEFLIKHAEPRTHRRYKEYTQTPFLSKRDSHKNQVDQADSGCISTPQLLRHISSIQFKTKGTIRKDEMFILLKSKNISVYHSQQKQKKEVIQKTVSIQNQSERPHLANNIRIKKTFSNPKWRFKHQKYIIKMNAKDDKVRKEKEKIFLNRKPLLKCVLETERVNFLRF